jgi:diadenosine tetraphosphate (Ap4A) HIT family hydrolase
MSDCHVCKTLSDPQQVLYDAGPWAAFLVANVPGWVMLGTKEHVEGMWGLSDDEAAGFGPAVRTIGRAVKETTGAERVHLVYLGENALHFHVGFFPRQRGEPPLLENGRMLEELKARANEEEARELGAKIAAAIKTA